MQTPRGGFFEQGKFVVTSHLEAIFNPDMIWSVTHMWVAALEITVFVVGGLSAWYIYKRRHEDFFLASFKWAVIAAVVITPLQIFLGDGSGRSVYLYDPAKLAAFEAHWETKPAGTGRCVSCHRLAGPGKADQPLVPGDSRRTESAHGSHIDRADQGAAGFPPAQTSLPSRFRFMRSGLWSPRERPSLR